MRLSTPILAAAVMAANVGAVVRKYTLVVTHGTVAPDGVSRSAWLVNGKSGLSLPVFMTLSLIV
jgi:hypothetical protein